MKNKRRNTGKNTIKSEEESGVSNTAPKKEAEKKTPAPSAPVTKEPVKIVSDDLEDEFAKFNNTVSDFKPEQPPAKTDGTILAETETDTVPLEQDLGNQFKIKMFLGFGLFLVGGLNTWILNKFRGGDIAVEDMELSEPEKKSVSKYLYTPEFLAWLAKIPSWFWAILHIEFMYVQKYNFQMKLKKLKNKKEK